MSKKVTKPKTIISEIDEIPLTIEIEQTLPYTYEDGSMFFPMPLGKRQVFFVDISYFKSDGNNTELHYVDRTVKVINLALLDLEERLNPEDFMRISNTFIINLHESAGLNNRESFVVRMKKARTDYGQRNNAEGGEIELMGSPGKKEEYLKRQERFGIDIKRR